MLPPLAVDASHPFPPCSTRVTPGRAKTQPAVNCCTPIVRSYEFSKTTALFLMPRAGRDEGWETLYLAYLIKHHIADLFPVLILERRSALGLRE